MLLQLFRGSPETKSCFSTDPDIAEWDYGGYEGLLTKDIRKQKPDWSIWDDG